MAGKAGCGLRIVVAGVRHVLWLLVATLFLGACAPAKVRDESMDAYVDLVGGSVVLNRALTVPPGSARVFLQRGEVVAKQDLHLYTPSCDFEVYDVLEADQVIEPDRFAITRAGVGMREWVLQGPVYLAAASGAIGLGGGMNWVARDDGAPMVMYTWEMQLRSERQPNVLKLTCRGEMGDPGRIEKTTLQEMRTALGGVADLNPTP